MIRISIILPYVCNRSGFRVQGSKVRVLKVQVKRFKGCSIKYILLDSDAFNSLKP
jgi:hypothetical protein